MDGCNDKRFEKMLYAYELGLLSDMERREFEIHLLECDSCFERAKEFIEAVKLIRFDPVVHDSIRKLAAEQPDETQKRSRHKPRLFVRWRVWPAILRPSVVVVAILALLIFKPWKIEIHPRHEAIASQNRIAVTHFNNLADPQDPDRLGEIAANLLITDLSESSYLQVLSGQRIDDIIKLLGKEEAKVIDRDLASRIARKARAKWLLLGNILRVEPTMVLTSQLIDVSSGEVVASTRVTGEPGENIFSLVDKMTIQVKTHLSLPSSAQREADRLIAEVTTHSAEAYRYFLEGIDNYNKLYFPEATTSFEKALEYDSTFASAYYYLAKLHSGPSAHILIKKAVKYSEKASHKERLYIKSLHYWLSKKSEDAISVLEKTIKRYPDEKDAYKLLGAYFYAQHKYEDAIYYYNEVIKIDPLDKMPYNMLAYSYDRTDNLEKSIWAINEYISLAPNEANPYDTRGEIYAKNGRLEEAIESFKKAIENKPDFAASILNLGFMYLFKREYDKAEDYFQEYLAVVDKTYRPAGRLYLACVQAYQGKFDRALEILDAGIGADQLELATPTLTVNHSAKYLLKARILAEKNQPAAAVEEFEKYMEIHMRAFPGSLAYFWNLYIQLLVENNNFEKAEESTDDLKNLLEYHNATLAPYYYALGCIEFSKGNINASVANFEEASALLNEFQTLFMLGRAYMESDRTEDAIDIYEDLLDSYNIHRAFWCIWSVKIHYYLGLLYDQSGQFDKAVVQYNTFLDIWKDADPGIDEVNEAAKRAAALLSM